MEYGIDHEGDLLCINRTALGDVEARELGDSLEVMESSPLGVDRWIEDTGASLLET